LKENIKNFTCQCVSPKINKFFYLLKGVSQGKNYLLDSIEIHINEPADSINRVTFVHDELVQLKTN
jgi:hypothetical protein